MRNVKNIRLTIEYDGSRYSGWQYQPRQKTIQGEIERAARQLTGQKVTLYAAGRTDAGVHARGQVTNFKIRHGLPVSKYREGLNFYLPDDIRIRKAGEVSLDFHARYDAVYRHYRYFIDLSPAALRQSRRWTAAVELPIKKLDAFAELVKGDHDFSTFCVVSSQKENNRCLVYRSLWRRRDNMLIYEIIADRFLHTMIRSLVGLMVETARSNGSIRQFNRIFRSGDHSLIKRVAPAAGLCLEDVGY